MSGVLVAMSEADLRGELGARLFRGAPPLTPRRRAALLVEVRSRGYRYDARDHRGRLLARGVDIVEAFGLATRRGGGSVQPTARVAPARGTGAAVARMAGKNRR